MTIELPPLPEWSTHDDLDRMVPSEIRTALVVYARAAVNVALEQAADEIERLRDVLLRNGFGLRCKFKRKVWLLRR